MIKGHKIFQFIMKHFATPSVINALTCGGAVGIGAGLLVSQKAETDPKVKTAMVTGGAAALGLGGYIAGARDYSRVLSDGAQEVMATVGKDGLGAIEVNFIGKDADTCKNFLVFASDYGPMIQDALTRI